MKNINQKIRTYLSSFFLGVLGGSPRKYWIYVLSLFLLFLIGVFVLDGIVFWRTTSFIKQEIDIATLKQSELINEAVLGEVVSKVKEKEEKFIEILSTPLVRDSSL